MIRYESHVIAWRDHNREQRRAPVDFSVIPERQNAIHARLQNWGLYCHGGRRGNSASPMFRGYQSPARVREARDIPQQINFADAMRVNQLVRRLPLMHARSVQWYYVEGGSPAKAARRIGFVLVDTPAGLRAALQRLCDTVIEARDRISLEHACGFATNPVCGIVRANV